MRHFASPSFLELYEKLPSTIQKLADKNFELLKADPKHPSLHLKKAGKYRSSRVGMKYRALGVEIDEGMLWFWIGTHTDYDSEEIPEFFMVTVYQGILTGWAPSFPSL